MKWIFGVLAAISLAACGTAYISPQIDGADPNVQIVPMTSQSVADANADTYVPQQIPAAFFQNAGGASAFRGPGAAPEPSLTAQERPAALATRLPPETRATPYTIGVGDVVLLATKSAGGTVEELSGLLAAQNSRQGYTVQDDGAIAVPDVGRIMLDGLTLEEAEAALFQSLVANGIEPTFSLEIAEFNSKRVSVAGAVASAAIVPVTLTPLFLDEAITRAGGVSTPDADFASIRIYRSGDLYQIPLSRYLSEPDLRRIRLAPGDSVFVDTEFELERARAYFQEQITLSQFRQQGRIQALAELNAEVDLRRASLIEGRGNFQDRVLLDAVDRDYVYLTGEVANKGRFAMPFGQQTTLADALFSDGGFSTETGNPAQIYVLRDAAADEAGVTAWHLDARVATNFVLATKMNLRPNDIIFVAEQPITRWNRVVQQLVPSLITTGVGIAAR